MSDLFSKTYKMESGPPHVPFDDYFDSCAQGYRELLSENPDELSVQGHLEKHPCLVPDHSRSMTTVGAHPYLSLITQPRLPTSPSYVPDFMWISANNLAWSSTLIEIEKPGKKMFIRSGRTSAKFNQARDQLTDWRAWFAQPVNVLSFIEYFGLPDHLRKLSMRHYQILIFGRRSEFEGDPVLTKNRGVTLDNDELISFDRLSANRHLIDAITVRATGSGRYEAIWVPEVFGLGSFSADRLRIVDGIPDAIDMNPNISPERKTFLKERIPYWKEWSTGARGTINGADRE